MDTVAAGAKTLVITTGTSGKGMGAAGTDVNDEIDRCSDGRKLYVTLGQFAIIKLERDIQLLMPAYDICMPEKECCVDNSDPCALFEKFKFPVDEFFPPELRMPTPLPPAGPDCGCKRHC